MSRTPSSLSLGIPVRDEDLEALRAGSTPEPGLGEGLGAAISNQWAGAWAARQISASGFARDEDFILSNSDVRALTAGLPEAFWDFSEAVSMDHALAIRQQRLGQVRNLETLSRLGWTGMALSIGAAILDPVDIAVGAGVAALTGGTGLAPWLAGKAGRLRRLAGHGVLGAASAVPVQAYISSQDPVQDEWDVLYAALGGAIGGAGFDALGQRFSAAARRTMRDIEARDVLALGAASPREVNTRFTDLITQDKGRLYFRGSVGDDDKALLASRLLNSLGLDASDEVDGQILRELSDLIDADPDAFLGRLRQTPGGLMLEEPDAPFPLGPTSETASVEGRGLRDSARGETSEASAANIDARRAGDFRLTSLPEDDPIRFGRGRFSYVAEFGRSEAPLVRRWGLAALGDPLPRKGGPAPLGASEWVHRATRGENGRFLREFEGSYRAHRASAPRGARSRAAFSRAVAEAVRTPDPQPGQFTDAVLDGARAVRESLARTLDTARRHGAFGSQDVESFAEYLPRLYSAPALNRAIALHGQDEVDRLFAEAFARAHPDLENVDEIAAKVGRRMRQTILDAQSRTDFDRARAVAGIDPDEMTAILKEAGVTDRGVIDDVLYGVGRGRANPEDAGTSTRLRARVLLDEQTTLSTPVGRLSFADILDNDAESIVGRYTRQMIGHAALAPLYRAVGDATGRTIRTQGQLLSALHDDLRAARVPTQKGVLSPSIDSTIDLARQIDNHLRGVPLVKDQGLNRMLRRMRQYQHLRLSGTFGLASLPETAQIAAETGLMAAVRGMPSLGRLLDDFKAGRIGDDFLREIEQVLGTGLDQFTHRVARHAEDDDALRGGARAGRAADAFLDRAASASNYLNFLAPLTRFQQLWAAGAAIQKWAAIARSGRLPSPTRLRAMNVTREQAERIVGAIRREADLGRGVVEVPGALFGRKVRRLDFSAWGDQDAASLLIDAVDKWSRRIIQTSDIGSMLPWMANSAWGRTLTQFRSFAVQAYEKQFLQSLTAPDAATAMRIVSTGIAGALVWAGQQYVRSLSEEDPQGYREKTITNAAMARAWFARSGWSSVLPGAMDNLLALGGSDDALFNFRNSGLGSRLVDAESSASLAFLNDLARAGNSTIGPLWREDDPLSRRDAESLFNILPWKNALGARSLFRSMLPADLPETDRDALR